MGYTATVTKTGQITLPKAVQEVLPFYASHPDLSFVNCYAAFDAEIKPSHSRPLIAN